jgi:hypothetical protein
MGTKSFKSFLTRLNTMESKSLSLTKDVLNERASLEVNVIGLQNEVQRGLNKLEQLRVEQRVLREHQSDIDKNKNFKYTVEEDECDIEPIDPGIYTTNCMVCKFTCHLNCAYKDDSDKQYCCAMRNGDCTVCPTKCHWTKHKNLPYVCKMKRVTVTKTAADLKARYEEAKGKKMTAEQIIAACEDEFCDIQLKVVVLTNEIRETLKKLDEIALKPNPLSTAGYIDILIRSEEQQADPGWQERVKQLKEVREQVVLMQKYADAGFDPFEKYRDMIKEEIGKKSDEKSRASTKWKRFKNWMSELNPF